MDFVRFDPTELATRVRGLAVRGRRVVVGIAGPPGSGKSLVAESVGRVLGPEAVVLPMDGFHLANDVLRTIGLLERKGAPQTFDAEGFIAILQRIRRRAGTVYAPKFDRSLDEAIAGAIAIPGTVRFVLAEGNYLLFEGRWAALRSLLDAVWWIDVDPQVRRSRLIARHRAYGKSPAAAERWVDGTDERNARVIARTRRRADLIITNTAALAED